MIYYMATEIVLLLTHCVLFTLETATTHSTNIDLFQSAQSVDMWLAILQFKTGLEK